MTSKERHEIRYKRRKERRNQNKIKRAMEIKPFSDMYNFNSIYSNVKKSCNGVRWKTSIKNFERHRFSNCAKLAQEMRDFYNDTKNQYKNKKYKKFTISERGKIRHIDAPDIRDKVIQKVYSTEVLHKLYPPIMIYNNGASQKGKGTAFAQRLLKQDLINHYKKYGKSGNIILIDFHNFFPDASHDVIKERHKELFYQDSLVRLGDMIVDSVNKGMPLGIEPSQYEMIAFPSKMDNYIRCQLHISGFGRYMDDYYIIVPPTIDANFALEKVKEKASSIGLQFSENKTKIIPFGQPFKYCKVKYIITDTGKILRRANRENIKRLRRKIKAFCKKEMNWIDVRNSVQSTIGYLKHFNNHNDLLKINRLFYSLYGFSCSNYISFCSGIMKCKNVMI